MVAPLAAVAAGALAARFVALDFPVWLAVALALGLAACLGLALSRSAPGAALCLTALVACGAGAVVLPDSPDPHRIDRLLNGLDLSIPVRLGGWVRRPPEALVDADQFILEVEQALDQASASGGVLVTVRRGPDEPPLELHYGQRIELLARARELRNYETPGAFDRVGFENRLGLFLRASVRPFTPIHRLEGVRGSRFEALMWGWRRELTRRFDRLSAAVADRQSAELVRAMTLGENRGIDPHTRADFERTGAYHVLVVSGLHVGLLAGIAIGVVRLFGAPRWLAGSVGALAAWAYALLLDTALPVTRAAAMLTFYVGALAVYRERNRLNAIAAAGLVFVAYDPDVLGEVSFQMSFLSVAAIAGIAAPLLDQTLALRRSALRDLWNLDLDLHLSPEAAARRVALRNWLDPLTRLLRLPRAMGTALLLAPLHLALAAAAIGLVSIVLTVALAAPLAIHFQRIAGAAPLANLAATPLLGLIAPAGLLALFTDSDALFRFAVAVAGLLRHGLDLVASTGLDARVPPPPAWLAGVSGVAALVCVRAFLPGGRGRGASLAALAVLAAIIAVHPFPARVEAAKLELTALDVGQGESLLLALPEGQVGLVDAGGIPDYDGDGVIPFDVGERVVSPYLWSRSIRRLDFLAITHPDIDHLGGAYAVTRNFRPRELWLPAGVFEADFRELTELARSLGTKVRPLGADESFQLGGATFRSLGGKLDGVGRNDLSLALMVRYGEHEFLLAGDLEARGEARLASQLAPMQGEVLKVDHHGSRNSTIPLLLERFHPRIALISAGYDNVYGHPHQETLERLERSGVQILRTDRDGVVSVISDGATLHVARRIPLERHSGSVVASR